MCCPPTVAGPQLGSFQPDLLILGLAMPDLDSLEVCRSA
jgi:DNA-binding response OmpR family regulator